jgi:hypothetical protein
MNVNNNGGCNPHGTYRKDRDSGALELQSMGKSGTIKKNHPDNEEEDDDDENDPLPGIHFTNSTGSDPVIAAI